ncbi:YcnI family protein [Actinacidiphila glaucinigra]|uniref:YcnI family copper-binding membrane protein n=1 Tax=Actinacidiphila glaucinigra TaxID=235986 RepID=UPI0038698C5B
MRSSFRIGVAAAAAAAGIVLASTPAFAHVSVEPESPAAKGGYATVDFKVPNELDNASTTKLEVVFPADHPLASVRPQAIAGWDIKVTKSNPGKPLTLHGASVGAAVTEVTWTATGKGIAPGSFRKFPLSLGQLPRDADRLVFKALQTYSDKQVVRWIEPQVEGQEEPEHPAPTRQLAAATQNDHHEDNAADQASATKDSDTDQSDNAEKNTTPAAGDTTDGTARGLGIAGLAVGAAGILSGALAGHCRSRLTRQGEYR